MNNHRSRGLCFFTNCGQACPCFRTLIIAVLFLWGTIINIYADETTSETLLHQSDFAELPVGRVAGGYLVLEGDFSIQEIDGKKVLALPGTPVGEMGVLFGFNPTVGAGIEAVIQSKNRGRVYPRFGVGLGGSGGFKLKIDPSKRALILTLDETEISRAAYRWKSEELSHLKLEVRKVSEEKWNVKGRAWPDRTAEPPDWMIDAELNEEPFAAQAAFWGTPYSEEPIIYHSYKIYALPVAE